MASVAAAIANTMHAASQCPPRSISQNRNSASTSRLSVMMFGRLSAEGDWDCSPPAAAGLGDAGAVESRCSAACMTGWSWLVKCYRTDLLNRPPAVIPDARVLHGRRADQVVTLPG